MPRRGRERVRRPLAVGLDNPGDMIVRGPALRRLRRALPAARTTLMASPTTSRAAEACDLPGDDRRRGAGDAMPTPSEGLSA